MNPIIPAAITAGAGVVGNLIAGSTARKMQRRSVIENRRAAELEYQRNVEFWNMQNAYNTPAAQMQRYKDAGLNPNLIYGQGSPGNASGIAPYQAPRVDYTGLKPMVNIGDAVASALGTYQDFRLKNAQIDNVRAATMTQLAKEQSEGFRSFLLQMQGRKTEEEDRFLRQVHPDQAGIINRKAQQSEAELQQSWQQLKNLQQDEVLKLLVQQEKQKGLSLFDLEKEKKEAELLFQKYRNSWMAQGITSSDNPLLRVLVRMLAESGFTLQQIIGD